MNEIERIEDDFKKLILGTCNIVGCKDCTMKFIDGDRCESDILQDRIIELKERAIASKDE